MAVRFVIGRAGTGKTHHCLEAVRSRLRADPIDGPRLILLVPEQASLQMERAVFASPGDDGADTIGGSHRAEVLSFQRLARRVLEAVGDPPRVALTEPARAMVLRHLVARLVDRLQYYNRVARPGRSGWRVGGFIDRLSATVGELIEEAVEPGRLQPVEGADIDTSAEAHPARSAKLHDLHLIYAAYLEYLGVERIDPGQYLQLARARLGECSWLAGAELWVDGFASLSGQETAMLVELVRSAARAEITALIDPGLAGETAAGGVSAATARMFSRSLRLVHDLTRTFDAAGIDVGDAIVLNPSTPPRYGENPGLAGLERDLFAVSPGEPPAPRRPTTGVELVALPSQRLEVDYAVSRIVRWVHDPEAAMRFRDLAIIVRDLEPYHDLIAAALRARGIPYFIDRRRPIAHHPLVELLRCAVALATEDLSLESVRLALKTGLLPLSDQAGDELENYLLAHAISGSLTWRAGDWSFTDRSRVLRDDPPDGASAAERSSLERINRARHRIMECWDGWLSYCTEAPARSGAEWSAATAGLLATLRVARTLRDWSERAEHDGDLDGADEHRQAWAAVQSVLDDVAFAFSDSSLSVTDYADGLEAGLSPITLGLVPPTIDQVLVGSIDRSRHPDIRAAVILGFNDGVFPRTIEEDSILNDDDRLHLSGRGLRIGSATRDRVVDESLLVYIAATRPSRSLVVTWSTSDSRGRAMRPSPYVEAILAACPGLVITSETDPARTRSTWDVLDGGDLAMRLPREFRSRPARQRDDAATRARWNAMYSVARDRLRADAVSRRSMTGLDDPRPVRVSTSSVERLAGGALRTSVSRLESYAACPFQYFARYGLSLGERLEALLESIDVGQVHHAVLEAFVSDLVADGRSLGEVDDEEMLDRLRDGCARIARRLPQGGFLSDARNAYRLRRSAEQLARILRAQRHTARAGRFRPRAAELPFGFDGPDSLPALVLDTPAGRRVHLRGYIDRVDIAELGDDLLGAVVDYKWSRDRRLSLGKVYHGLSLQLIAYLLALSAHGRTLTGRRVRPVGAMFVNLAPTYESVDRPADVGEEPGSTHDATRPRGLIHADGLSALDAATSTGRSSVYNFHRRKDGSLGDVGRSDGADADAFDAVLSHARTRMGELADGIIDGAFAVRPYRLGAFSPCSWCSMSSVCRFEAGLSDIRFLESLKRADVLARLVLDRGSSGDPGA